MSTLLNIEAKAQLEVSLLAMIDHPFGGRIGDAHMYVGAVVKSVPGSAFGNHMTAVSSQVPYRQEWAALTREEWLELPEIQPLKEEALANLRKRLGVAA